MAHDPVTEHLHVPTDTTWHQPNDPVWPTPDDADRILTHTDTNTAIVCCPRSACPTIERGSPHFTTCLTTTTAPPDAIARTLDAINTHCRPTAPCYFGVRYDRVQTYGRGHGPFHTLLTDPVADDARSTPATETQPPRPHLVGSCCWPTEQGTAVLEATRGEHSQPHTFQVTVGLLATGPLTRPETVAPVFEAVDESLPRIQDQWPLRQLVIDGTRQRLARTEPIAEDTLGTVADHHLLRHHGSNPVYGTPAEELPTDLSVLRDDVYGPLRSVSTLLYEQQSNHVSRALGLDRLVAVDPPLRNTLVVSGTVRIAA